MATGDNRPLGPGQPGRVVVSYGIVEDRQSKPADFARFRVAAAAFGGRASEETDWHPSGPYRTTRDLAAFFSEAGLRRIQTATVADLARALGSAPTKKQAAELRRLKRRLLSNASAPGAIFELNPDGPGLGDNWACGYEDRLALAGLLAGDEVTLLRASLSHPFNGPRVEFSSDAPVADPGYVRRFCSEGYTVASPRDSSRLGLLDPRGKKSFSILPLLASKSI